MDLGKGPSALLLVVLPLFCFPRRRSPCGRAPSPPSLRHGTGKTSLPPRRHGARLPGALRLCHKAHPHLHRLQHLGHLRLRQHAARHPPELAAHASRRRLRHPCAHAAPRRVPRLQGPARGDAGGIVRRHTARPPLHRGDEHPRPGHRRLRGRRPHRHAGAASGEGRLRHLHGHARQGFRAAGGRAHLHLETRPPGQRHGADEGRRRLRQVGHPARGPGHRHPRPDGRRHGQHSRDQGRGREDRRQAHRAVRVAGGDPRPCRRDQRQARRKRPCPGRQRPVEQTPRDHHHGRAGQRVLGRTGLARPERRRGEGALRGVRDERHRPPSVRRRIQGRAQRSRPGSRRGAGNRQDGKRTGRVGSLWQTGSQIPDTGCRSAVRRSSRVRCGESGIRHQASGIRPRPPHHHRHPAPLRAGRFPREAGRDVGRLVGRIGLLLRHGDGRPRSQGCRAPRHRLQLRDGHGLLRPL